MHSLLGCSVAKYFSVQPLEVKWSSEPNRVLQEICPMLTFTKCGVLTFKSPERLAPAAMPVTEGKNTANTEMKFCCLPSAFR